MDGESVISSHLSRRCLKVKRLNTIKSATLDEFVFDKIKTENKQQGLTLADQISRQKLRQSPGEVLGLSMSSGLKRASAACVHDSRAV